MAQLHALVAIIFTVISSVSAENRFRRETCSIFRINTARIPRFDRRQYDGVILQKTLLVERRSVDTVSLARSFTRVNRANKFEFHEAGLIWGTNTCGALSFEGVGKTANNDPCQTVNVTRPINQIFGEVLFIPMDRRTLGIALCDKKQNGICVDGLLTVMTKEARLTDLRKYRILRHFEYNGLLKEFGIKGSDVSVVDQRLNNCEFPEEVKKLIRLSARSVNRKRKHYRY